MHHGGAGTTAAALRAGKPSIVIPFYQEYFDPIIFILLFFVYNIRLKLNYKRVYFFYIYFLVFLIGTHIYYN